MNTLKHGQAVTFTPFNSMGLFDQKMVHGIVTPDDSRLSCGEVKICFVRNGEMANQWHNAEFLTALK